LQGIDFMDFLKSVRIVFFLLANQNKPRTVRPLAAMAATRPTAMGKPAGAME
jgi:hypothetical protein